MELTWWGTAGFQFKTGNQVFLIDPYLSRNTVARPNQKLVPSDISAADQIFVSHGHFDHIMDIPKIAAQTGCIVYCCPVTAKTLQTKGIPKDQIHVVSEDGYEVALEGCRPGPFSAGMSNLTAGC